MAEPVVFDRELQHILSRLCAIATCLKARDIPVISHLLHQFLVLAALIENEHIAHALRVIPNAFASVIDPVHRVLVVQRNDMHGRVGDTAFLRRPFQLELELHIVDEDCPPKWLTAISTLHLQVQCRQRVRA